MVSCGDKDDRVRIIMIILKHIIAIRNTRITRRKDVYVHLYIDKNLHLTFLLVKEILAFY